MTSTARCASSPTAAAALNPWMRSRRVASLNATRRTSWAACARARRACTWASAQAAPIASICPRTCRVRLWSRVAVTSPWRCVTSRRMRRSSSLSASASRMICCTRLGVCEIAIMTVRWPRSICVASTTSCARVKSGTRLVSARYTRTRSLDVSRRLGVRSGSSASRRARRVPARCSDSESTSMPASRHWLSRSSNTDDAVTSAGRVAAISSRRRYPFSAPTAMSCRMASSCSPLDRETPSAREDIVSYAITRRGSDRDASRGGSHAHRIHSAWLMTSVRGDSLDRSQRGVAVDLGKVVSMKATGTDALNLIRHWK